MSKLTSTQRESRINVVAYKLADLFRTYKNFMPTHGLTEPELYEAMRRGINLLEKGTL